MINALTLNLPISTKLGLKFNPKILWFFMLLVMLFLLAFCIFQVNAYTRDVYLVTNYEKKLNQLTQENKILEISFSGANSLKNIGNYVQNGGFEKANQIDYIRLLESTVLAK